MQRTANALSVTFIATSLLSLTGCAATPVAKPGAEPDPIVLETKPRPEDKVFDKDIADPVVKADPSDPPSGRNHGFGPYDTIEAICAAMIVQDAPPEAPEQPIQDPQPRCSMSKPVVLTGSQTISRMASFVSTRMDGQAHLAFETKEGWFISSVPDGNPFGGGLSHHTPAWTHFLFDKANADGAGVVLLRTFGQSMFLPGQGSRGSSRFEEVVRLKCSVVGGRVACGEGKSVFSRSCNDGKCSETGVDPAGA